MLAMKTCSSIRMADGKVGRQITFSHTIENILLILTATKAKLEAYGAEIHPVDRQL